MQVSSNSEAFISVEILSDSLNYLSLREDHIFCQTNTPLKSCCLMKPSSFLVSDYLTVVRKKPWQLWNIKYGTVPHIHFLHYRKYVPRISWLCPHSQIAKDMRIHKVSCCSLLPEYFFSFSKNFCIMNECPLDRIYPQGFVRNSYLHPGYYPRSTDNDDDTTGQFFSISLSFCSQLFQHLLWQPLQSLFKIVETLPAPVNSDSFSVFQQSTIIFTEF